jgi:DNA-binding NarL/FixJ family response regulator
MIRVLICDDAVAFSRLVEYWLSDCDDIEVVGIAPSGKDALEQLAPLAPDVVVLDHLLYDMPRGSEELGPRLRERRPELRIVLISSMPTDDLAAVAARCGADAYLSKASTPEALCDAIRRAALA